MNVQIRFGKEPLRSVYVPFELRWKKQNMSGIKLMMFV